MHGGSTVVKTMIKTEAELLQMAYSMSGVVPGNPMAYQSAPHLAGAVQGFPQPPVMGHTLSSAYGPPPQHVVSNSMPPPPMPMMMVQPPQMQQQQPMPMPMPVPVPVPMQPHALQQMQAPATHLASAAAVYCSNCGTPFNGMRFCAGCGASAAAAPPPLPSLPTAGAAAAVLQQPPLPNAPHFSSAPYGDVNGGSGSGGSGGGGGGGGAYGDGSGAYDEDAPPPAYSPPAFSDKKNAN